MNALQSIIISTGGCLVPMQVAIEFFGRPGTLRQFLGFNTRTWVMEESK